jgi:D-sedoheptulose 7-phosphate isomerase
MNVAEYFQSEFAEHHAVARATEQALASGFAGLLAACVTSIRAGGKIMLFGNGGSAADAQHLATELTIRYKKNRATIAAIALTTDTSALTACGNDLGFDLIFARQVEALGKPGDVALAISTSGMSPNIVAALQQARAMKIVTGGFGGKGGGEMKGLTDHLLIVPSDSTARIQEMHILLGHLLCGALEIELGLAK